MSYEVERGRPYQAGTSGNSGFVARDTQREDPLVSSLKENIKQIQNNVTSITKFATGLGTPKDSTENRAKLNATIETTKQIAKTATQQMKDLGNTARGNGGDLQQQRMVQQKLAKDLGLWVQKFQEISKVAAQKERSTPLPAAPAPYNSASQGSRQQALRAPSDQYHQYDDQEDEKQSLLEASRRENLQQIENEREFNDAMIQDREEGIKQIESTIVEVNGIFTDLAQIVHEQGFMIDNIESNVESASHNTAEAVVQLREASKYQKKSRTKMCVLALIIAIVIGVISVLIYVGVRLR
jgi:syntaxin 7